MQFKLFRIYHSKRLIIYIMIILFILSLCIYFRKYIQALVLTDFKDIKKNYYIIIISKTVPLLDVNMNWINPEKFISPLAGTITSKFGLRNRTFHQGVDIAAPIGTPVYAFMDGKVTFCGWEGGYGDLVVIDHKNGIKSYYGHNSKLLVISGQQVKKGQHISDVGNTGDATGPHCHFEIRKNNIPIDPIDYIR